MHAHMSARIVMARIIMALSVCLTFTVGPVSAVAVVPQASTAPGAAASSTAAASDGVTNDAASPAGVTGDSAVSGNRTNGDDPFDAAVVEVDLPAAGTDGSGESASPQSPSPPSVSAQSVSPQLGIAPPDSVDGANPAGADSAGQLVELPFDAEFVIVQWDGDPDAVFALRSLGPDGWSPTVELSFEVVDGPDRDAAGGATEGPAVAVTAAPPVWTGWGTTAVTLAVVSGSPTNVRVEALRSTLDRPEDPSTWTIDPQATTAEASVAPASVAAAGVVTRAQWGAMPWASANPGCGTTPATTPGVDLMVVHHTASNNTYTQADAMSQVRAIQRYHVVTLQWCDVGYNFLVDRYGTIYEGRQGSINAAVRGSHASGYNTSTMGISMLGQYHPGASPAASTVPAVQLDAMIRIIAALGRQWNINPAARTTYAGQSLPVVVGHRDVNATSCPGDYAYPLLANMRVDVPTTANDPFGNFEEITSAEPGTASVSGWVIDPDTPAPVEVHVYANGKFAAVGVASLPRPDVGTVYPASGPDHGFNITFGLPGGRHEVCVFAINIPPGIANPLLGCRTIDVAPRTDPFGSFDSLSSPAPGQLRARGWAIDPDTVDPIAVHLYANGAFAGAVTASAVRNDVAAAHPASGPNHGFDTVIPVPGGRVQVCAYAINVGPPGVNTPLGCRSAQLPTGNPFGNFEALTSPGPGQVRIRGWAIDPDTTAPVTLHVYANGVFVGAPTAAGIRNDVGAAYPAYGAAHGFNTVVSVPGGRTDVCVFALNVAGGNANTLLGCRTAQLPTGNPVGNFEALTSPGPGQVRIRGWAIDPDTVNALTMHVYVNGSFAGTAGAGLPRPDVAAVFPAYGPNHGFDTTLSVSGLPADVCVFALNAGPGTANTLLGCRRI